jgi:lipopolysaccharide assembly outer membrane protein LptD (OstA)
MSRHRNSAPLALGLPLLLLLGLAPPAAAQQDEPADPLLEQRRRVREGVKAAKEKEAREARGEEDEATAEAYPRPDRVSFDLSFPAGVSGEGGGSATGSAGAIEYQGTDFAQLTGGVEIFYQDLVVQADNIDVNLATKEIVATGNVILDQGPRRLAGVTLTYNLDEKTGVLSQGSAYVDPDFYFWGTEIRKTGEDTFTFVDGTFTSCAEDNPDWSFKVNRAEVEVGGFAKVWGAQMRVKKAPVFYWPYMVWPVKEDRASGWLMPNIGYSDRRGGYLGLAYYKTFGRSYDTTFYADLYSNEFWGLGNEFRYQPSENTEGVFEGYGVWDPDDEEIRYKINWDHETTDLPFGMRGVLTVREFSDFQFFRDFERDIDRNTIRSIESRGFLTGNWGPHSLNILVKKRETFISDTNQITLSQLPEVEYRLRPYQLGETPIFLKMESSVSYLDADRGAALDGGYGRADLFPQIDIPLRLAPWFSFKASGGYRYTWYGDSLTTDRTALSGETVTREIPFGSAEIVGPSFSRIYESGKRKMKHVIEPRWAYTFLGEDDDTGLVPLFDEIDTVNQTNLARFALVNRFLTKPKPRMGPDGEMLPEGSAREILSVEVARLYSFDDDRPLQRSADRLEDDQFGPITALLRYNPSDRTSLTTSFDYNTLFSQLQAASLSGTLGLSGNNVLGLSWRTRWNAETGDKLSDQVKLSAGIDVVPRRLRLQGDVVYDIERSLVQQQRYLLSYQSQCYSFNLEFRDARFGLEREKDFRFSLTLKNVGTFLDLTH